MWLQTTWGSETDLVALLDKINRFICPLSILFARDSFDSGLVNIDIVIIELN